VLSRFSDSRPADVKCSCGKPFRVFEQIDDVVDGTVNFLRLTMPLGLEGRYPLNELLHSFEVHYPIRFPCFATVG
jgi:hypothetical protein